MSLVIVGGTVLDVIFRGVTRLPTWPNHTEFTPSNLVQPKHAPLVTLGGNGANAAYVAAASGARVTLHTAIADDAFGGLCRGWLEAVGCTVCTSNRTEATAVNVTAADLRHRRATLFYRGAAIVLPRLSARTRGLRALLVCGWPHPPLRTIAREFSALRCHGVLTAFDPGPLLGQSWTLATLRPVLAHLDLLLINAHELGALARQPDLSAALRSFRRHHSGHVVVKCGGDGALWLPANESEPVKYRSRTVRVVNTVGAGDTFNGAMLAALTDGATFPAALRAANRTAARVVASPLGVLGARRT